MWKKIKEFDVFYISYDEPQKEEFWLDLKNKNPNAKRIDGIKGFDLAHKECAKQSKTNWLVTVDGDNIVNSDFFEHGVKTNSKSVYSWSSKNIVNGLVYGNGSLKLWPKKVIKNMKTHENAQTEKSKVDFCWDLTYIQEDTIFSTTHPNGSPFQAFRAGFREGVKMSLEQGYHVHPDKLSTELHDKNYQRLLIWCNVGADVENGLWAMYGARMGIYKNYLDVWDHSNISDYDWFDKFWKDTISSDDVKSRLLHVGEMLKWKLKLPMANLDDTGSDFFKQVYINPSRNI